MRFKKHAGAAMLLVLLCSVTGTYAQQADTVTAKALREVSVTAPRAAREVSPGQKMQAKELERLGSHSVADAIRFFAGLQVKDYGGIGGLKTVDIRSMGTNQVGVFYDGIQLGNAQNGQVDLGKFSLDNMEEIALYNGQKSNIFQPAKDFGSAGAIYLTSLKPKFAANEKNTCKRYHKNRLFRPVQSLPVMAAKDQQQSIRFVQHRMDQCYRQVQILLPETRR